jgi:hypothetical protein
MSSRHERIERFRRTADGHYVTSLRAAGEHRAADSSAIANWCMSQATARATCFGCRDRFGGHVKPAAFLTAAPEGNRHAVAVAAMCQWCWTRKTPEQIETDAVDMLRRQLCPRGRLL